MAKSESHRTSRRSVRLSTSVFALLLVLGVVLASEMAKAAAAFPVQGRRGMVVTSQADASEAGLAMLRAGGNAIDAAVAAAFAVGVTQPQSTGLGGGAFILIRLADGTVAAIDARETAPAAATRDMYLQDGVPERASLWGPLAVATPGLVAGLVLVLEEHGSLPLGQVMQPAIELALQGYEINAYQARLMNGMRERIPGDRFPETMRIQFPPEGVLAEPGWRLVQKDLGATLERIARGGTNAFYQGPIADAIADSQSQLGGLVTREDLAGYRAVSRQPVSGSYRGIDVFSYPPPSSGGVVLLQILNIVEGFDLAAFGAGSSASTHLVAEAMKLAFADRAAYLGDPDFVEIPVERLISKKYADEQRARINPAWFKRSPLRWFRRESVITVKGPGLPQNDAGTTHLSVTDDFGNAVAITKTINTPYGSLITVPGTGIILNNEMDDFAIAPDTPNAYGLIDTTGANAIAPRKRPLSSMTPTILVNDGKVFMVTGSPGGPRIITTTLHTILNVVDFGMTVEGAVSAPRFHHQWFPDKLFLEPGVPRDVVEALERRGHPVSPSSRPWSAAEAIVIDPETGWHFGGSDPRRGGRALGFPSVP